MESLPNGMEVAWYRYMFRKDGTDPDPGSNASGNEEEPALDEVILKDKTHLIILDFGGRTDLAGLKEAVAAFEEDDNPYMGAPKIVLDGHNYYATELCIVNEVPEGYSYAGELTDQEKKYAFIDGSKYYTPNSDGVPEDFYIYQECGTPVSEHEVDNTKRQWAYDQMETGRLTILRGIYMENNHNSAAKSQMTMHNEAPITLGDDGKGIVIRSTNTTGAGGTLTLKDSGSGRDIKVGKNGVGIYAQGSDVKMDGNYGIEIQEGGVALQSEGNTIISRTNAADKLTVDYAGTSGAGNTAIGIAFKGTTGNAFNNSMNMEVLNTSGAETIVGIYGTGAGTLTNSGDITAKSTGSYGIISEGVNVVNTGVVTVGDSLAPVSGTIGIYAKDASVDTVGKNIVIEGNGDSSTSVHPIGIYAKSSIAGNREIKVTNGFAPMSVAGKAGIGIYVEDTIGTALRLNNSSNITLGDSLSTADRRFGIFIDKC